VAAVNGAALAGGFALALLCDLRLASETASFGFPELPRGIPPSYAAARAALPRPLAAELTLTGRLLDAEHALDMGIVGAVYSEEELMPRAIELAGRIAAGPRGAIAETKRRIVLDRDRTIGHLFDEEERLLREALLGDSPDDAA
jgi:enoyl-CoA hydratase/carnithine racemase